MLLSFSFHNFRSVKSDCEIDFRKMSLKQHVNTLINGEVLPVTVFYGPNGGGKSTIIMALQYLSNLVSTPIKQFHGLSNLYMQSFKPFMLDSDSKLKPTEFCVIFTLDKESTDEYKYYIKLFENKILEESLYEKKEKGKASLVFNRTDDKIQVGAKFSLISPNMATNINPGIPYLSLCSIILSNSPISKVGHWFNKMGIIDFGNPTMELILPELFASFSNNIEIKKVVNELLTKFELISGFEVVDGDINSNGNKQKIILTHHNINGNEYSLTYNEESMGTKKILQILPLLGSILKEGGVLVVDELDAKLHPKLLEFIISLFTNPEVNLEGAQLIFTSHDMYTLNNTVFRRDEIWFACKDKDESTIVYSLGDIKGDDNRTVRADLSFSNQYLAGKYGADPYYNKMITWSDIDD